jgi:hypothetical protein
MWLAHEQAVVSRNDTGKLQKPHQKSQNDSEKHLYLWHSGSFYYFKLSINQIK